eukprot:Opistho-1_new@12503
MRDNTRRTLWQHESNAQNGGGRKQQRHERWTDGQRTTTTSGRRRRGTAHSGAGRLDEAAVPEVVLDDDVRDGGKHKLDVVRVRRAREVRVDLLLVAPVHLLKLLLDKVLGGLRVAGLASVLGEAHGEGRLGDLLGEEVRLVEEENDRRLEEPLRVADGVKQLDALVHAVRRLVLREHLVVPAQRRAKNDRRHILKAVNPLLALGPLATDVKHPEEEALVLEVRLDNASRLDTRAQHVLLAGHVVGRRNAVNAVEVVLRGVVELELGRARKARLNTAVLPEPLDGARELVVERDAVEVIAIAEHLLGVRLAVVVAVRNLKRLHRRHERLHRLDRVAVHNVAELDALLRRVTLLVDDLHLLHDGALARLTGAEQEQLNLGRHLALVILKLILDGLVAVLRLLVLRALCTPHLRPFAAPTRTQQTLPTRVCSSPNSARSANGRLNSPNPRPTAAAKRAISRK